MPARNAAGTLGACLDSIQAQTLPDFEVLVMDDGSRDGTGELVARRARQDPRLRLVSRRHSGLVACLNAGLGLARAPLVARMDADDLMAPDRLERQRRFLDAHPGVDVVASRVEAFPDRRLRAGMAEYLRWQNRCLASDALRDEIFVECPVTHPSVMFRRSAVVAAGGYRAGDFPEDYELWLRLTERGSGMAKIDACLLRWRQHEGSLSRTDPRYAREAFDRLRARYLARDPRVRGGRAVVFWGAGRRTRRRAEHLMARGVVPRAWIDVDPRKIGQRLGGAPVLPPEWLAQACPAPFVLTWVATHGARERIGAALEAMGYARGVDYLAVG